MPERTVAGEVEPQGGFQGGEGHIFCQPAPVAQLEHGFGGAQELPGPVSTGAIQNR